MQIVLTKKSTNFKSIYMNVVDISTNPLFYEFEITTDDLSDGEYELELYDDNNNSLATTLVKVGEYENTKITYNKKRKFITYNGRK